MLANNSNSGPSDRFPAKTPRSTLVSRNVTISNHRTSIRLEPEMWSALSDVCRREGASLHEVCSAVAARKGENTSLTAAIRVFVMAYYRAAATEEGHAKVKHGYGIAALANGNSGVRLQSASSAMPNSMRDSSVSSSGYTNRMAAVNFGTRTGFR